MTNTGWLLAGVNILIIIAAIILFVLPGRTHAPTRSEPGEPATTTMSGPDVADMIVVKHPVPGARIASPLLIQGEARGPWYFEASFPIEIRDASGAVIVQAPAQAQGEWMTEQFVPFAATLTFPQQPSGSPGTLVVRNDNPSGLPEHERFLRIPIIFQ